MLYFDIVNAWLYFINVHVIIYLTENVLIITIFMPSKHLKYPQWNAKSTDRQKSKQNYFDAWCTSSQMEWNDILNIKLSFNIETKIKKNVAAHVGTRTLDPQIKSLMLYRLSYAGYMNTVGKFTIFISNKTRITIAFSVLQSRYVCPSWHLRQHNCQVTTYNWMDVYIYLCRQFFIQ